LTDNAYQLIIRDRNSAQIKPLPVNMKGRTVRIFLT
jgi:hypothetical protein